MELIDTNALLNAGLHYEMLLKKAFNTKSLKPASINQSAFINFIKLEACKAKEYPKQKKVVVETLTKGFVKLIQNPKISETAKKAIDEMLGELLTAESSSSIITIVEKVYSLISDAKDEG